MREWLGILKNDQVKTLPNQLATLKNRIKMRFPLMDMRVADVPLKIEKLPTERATRKLEQQKAGPQGTITAELHAIDPKSMFCAFMSSDVAQGMHYGLAHFVDEPEELYHSHSWSSSVRTTSGEYAHVMAAEEDDEGNINADELIAIETIFPSDLVFYCCTNADCVCQDADVQNKDSAHIGRVYGTGRDYRTDFCTDEKGQIALQIQEIIRSTAFTPQGLLPENPFSDREDGPVGHLDMVLNSRITFVPQTYLIELIHDIAMDYYSGETFEDPSPAPTSGKGKGRAKDFPRYSHNPGVGNAAAAVSRALLADGTTVPLCHTHVIRAELEMEVYGRNFFQEWDRRKMEDSESILSCPILVFIDGFGLYRNSYRSLIGVYLIPAGLTSKERHRQANIFPITLSPHGSNFDDAVRALQSLGALDMGVEVTIDGKNCLLCVPTLCYIGDMPQQDKNSGFRGPKALKPCRFCYYGQKDIKSDNPSDILDFDVITHGRYHRQTVEMRKELDSLKTGAAKRQYASQWGLSEQTPALIDISPALDLILTRPPDPAHSEYQGMTELMHRLLLDGILTGVSQKQYGRELRVWSFPAGWERLMSPLHHLRSYSLAAHARWSVIVPTLLRSWLEPKHIHQLFMRSAKTMLLTDQDVVDYIVSSFACLAKSNSVLMGLKMTAEDRLALDDIVRRTRVRYQQLCSFAARSIVANPRAYSKLGSRAASVVSRGAGIIPAHMGDVEMANAVVTADAMMSSVEAADDDISAQVSAPKRAAQYIHDMRRPNVHLGVHYKTIAEEYALPVNVNTLLGEAQHRYVTDLAWHITPNVWDTLSPALYEVRQLTIRRYFKSKVYETNHSNVEKILLSKINLQMTTRMILQKGFYHRDGELTVQMRRLYNQCPTLFDSVTDRGNMLDKDELENEMDIYFGADEEHRRPTVIGAIPSYVVNKSIHLANGGNPMPRYHTHMTDGFKQLLRRAYVEQYGMDEIYRFGGRALQYSNKFAFTDR